MTKHEEAELFRVLSGIPRFKDWLSDQERDSVRFLKASKDSAVINHHQGRVSLIDEMLARVDQVRAGK